MNFTALEEDLKNAIAADEKYHRENSAKFRAVEQKVATYDEFKEIVKASHLKCLEKKEKLVDSSIAQKNVIWNVIAGNRSEDNLCYLDKKEKKHFTEI